MSKMLKEEVRKSLLFILQVEEVFKIQSFLAYELISLDSCGNAFGQNRYDLQCGGG